MMIKNDAVTIASIVFFCNLICFCILANCLLNDFLLFISI